MSIVPDTFEPEAFARLSLREKVELLLPGWQGWYPSLFDAAEDLGLIRARVCAPSSLMLSSRHASVQSEALQAFKEQWSVEDEPEAPQLPIRLQGRSVTLSHKAQRGKKARRR